MGLQSFWIEAEDDASWLLRCAHLLCMRTAKVFSGCIQKEHFIMCFSNRTYEHIETDQQYVQE